MSQDQTDVLMLVGAWMADSPPLHPNDALPVAALQATCKEVAEFCKIPAGSKERWTKWDDLQNSERFYDFGNELDSPSAFWRNDTNPEWVREFRIMQEIRRKNRQRKPQPGKPMNFDPILLDWDRFSKDREIVVVSES